jgi:rSAM/selenodomain-associated transferase 1
MTYKYPNAVIQVFCKAPVPGQVKTRLIPNLSAEQAAQLHQQLSRRTLELVTTSALCPIQLWCSPTISHPFFKEMATRFSLPLLPQSSGDLGKRMHNAISYGSHTYHHVIVIGCDCPSLTPDDLNDAIQALASTKEIVLAPAEDGGYCLIGMNTAQIKLFTDINWGTSEVLKKTRTKIQALGLTSHELKTQWDIDNYIDYKRFVNSFAFPFIE